MILTRDYETSTSGRFDTIDITAQVRAVAAEAGVKNGNVLVFSPHTTCCVLLTNEGDHTAEALRRAMDVLAPANGYYAHDDFSIRTENLVEDESENARAHIVHVMMGKASESIPVVDGEPALGPDQRVVFVELDSARPRRYCIQIAGE